MKRKVFLAGVLCGAVALAGQAAAQRGWSVAPAEPSGLAAEVSKMDEETGAAPEDGLPDGRVARSATGSISAAWYVRPTERYGHGILGDAVEAAGLRVRLRQGGTLTHVLPAVEVFEDRTPRLADLDGDGEPDVIAIRSSVAAGAAVTVYGMRGGALRRIATTPFIGKPNRWLNIAGIARFRGGKTAEIAYVQTPHIGGRLIFVALDGDALEVVARADGFSNHAIGSTEMRLSAVADANGDGRPDLALPRADRRGLRIVSLEPAGIVLLADIPLPAPIDKPIAAAGSGRDLQFFVGLDNGQVFRIARGR